MAKRVSRAAVVAGVVAGSFLFMNLLRDGFPLRCVSRVWTRMAIALPEGVTYQQWHRERFGIDPPPPEIIVNRPALAVNVVSGIAATVLAAVLAYRFPRTRSNPTNGHG